MRTRLIIVLLVLLITIKPAFTQETDTITKPKIGLVLSGGGAKGLAHIGVLKVLDEIGITPDYITGVSMGAVVGSLYALGYTAKEISELNSNADWNMLLSDRIPLNEVIFEEKYEYKRYIIGIPIRNYKFKLPSGMIEGQQLEKLFADVMWPLPEIESFDSLPIPFRCIGVDLISGKAMEFDSGNLAESIRASMSIPSIFTPESIDSMLLVDGGVIRNFPVEEVIKMGADIVIGIYVGFDEKVTKEDLFSLSDVFSRATVFYGIFDSKSQMALTDILLEPNLLDLGTSDFTKSKEIEILGEVSALEIQEELYNLADSFNLKYTPVKKFKQTEKIFIQEIEVMNDRTFVTDRFIIGRSGIKKGSYVSKEDLSEAVDKIFGTQYFKKVTYSIVALNDDNFKLVFKVKESTRAFLNIAAHYNNHYGPGIITNLTLRNYLAPASRAIVSLNIAENPGVRIDINKYVGKNQQFMDNVFFNWNQDENNFYSGGRNAGSYTLNNLTAGIGGKYSISVNQQIGMLGFYEINKMIPLDNLKNFYGAVSFDSYLYKGLAYKLYYNINTTDDNFFPQKGVKFDFCYKYNYKPEITYNIIEADKIIVSETALFKEEQGDFYMSYLNFELYNTFFDKLTFNAKVAAGISSDPSSGIGNYIIGGNHSDQRFGNVSFMGMQYSEAVVPNFGLVGVGLDLEIFPKVYLTTKANIGFHTQTKEDLIDYIKYSSFKSYLKGYGFGLKANTLLGPISVMYGDNDFDGDIQWYISVGYPF